MLGFETCFEIQVGSPIAKRRPAASFGGPKLRWQNHLSFIGYCIADVNIVISGAAILDSVARLHTTSHPPIHLPGASYMVYATTKRRSIKLCHGTPVPVYSYSGCSP